MEEESNVEVLLKSHDQAIRELLLEFHEFKTQDLGVPFDELFVLRFLLSNKDIQIAKHKLKETLTWRVSNRQRLNTVPFEDVMLQHVKRGFVGWLGNQYLVYVVRAGQGHPAAMVRALSFEQLVESLLYVNEQNFKLVDAKTRETGKLCKVITVLDLQSFSLLRFSPTFGKANGESSARSNILYPQLLHAMVAINLPSVFKMLFSLAQSVFTKETFARMKICRAKNTVKQDGALCPYLKKFGAPALDVIPTFLGGHAAIPVYLQNPEYDAV